jgi:predicted dehydrogenase
MAMSSPSPRWRIGIIGCGRMGRLHAERLRATGRVELAALHDVDRAAAESLRQSQAPDTVVAAGAEELIATPGLQGVVICSPTHEHVKQMEAVLSRGLHVLCEKPLADAASGLDRVLGLAEEARGHQLLAYQRRFWGTYRTLRREVQSGRWGAIRAVTSHNTERWQQTIAGTWRDDPAMNPGGFLGDAGSHKVDALFYVTGLEPREVFARTQRCGSRVEINISLSGLLSGDVPLTMDFIGNAEQQVEDLTIHCDDADLMVRDYRVWCVRKNEVRPLEPLEPTSDPATGFVAVLDGREQNPAPLSVARPVFELTAMALESARSGQCVRRDTVGR